MDSMSSMASARALMNLVSSLLLILLKLSAMIAISMLRRRPLEMEDDEDLYEDIVEAAEIGRAHV